MDLQQQQGIAHVAHHGGKQHRPLAGLLHPVDGILVDRLGLIGPPAGRSHLEEELIGEAHQVANGLGRRLHRLGDGLKVLGQGHLFGQLRESLVLVGLLGRPGEGAAGVEELSHPTGGDPNLPGPELRLSAAQGLRHRLGSRKRRDLVGSRSRKLAKVSYVSGVPQFRLDVQKRVDPNDPPVVLQERSAAVAGRDLGVVLDPDEVLGGLDPCHHARLWAGREVGRGEHPADDPLGEREVGVVGMAESVDLRAESRSIVVAEVENRQFLRRILQLHYRQIVLGAGGHDAGEPALGAVGKDRPGGRGGTGHHVIAGGDPAAFVDKEAAAVLHPGLAGHGHLELDNRLQHLLQRFGDLGLEGGGLGRVVVGWAGLVGEPGGRVLAVPVVRWFVVEGSVAGWDFVRRRLDILFGLLAGVGLVCGL